MTELDSQVMAVRRATALHEADHVHVVRVSGSEAFERVDRVFSRELYVQDGQMLHGLLLHEDGTVFADVYVARDEDDFVLLAEGPSAEALQAHLDADDFDAQSRLSDRRVVSLHGPYAWELLADFVGPEVIGLPYLTFFHDEHWSCYRAGKTGEFGYRLVIDRERADAVLGAVREVGERYGLISIGREALDVCALESWFYCIRFEGLRALTPLELQLQWRTSRRKQGFVGAEALAKRRDEGWQRITMLRSERQLDMGEAIRHANQTIGKVVHGAWSPTSRSWLSLGLLDREWAHSGLRYQSESGIDVATVTPPPIRNRSLFINLQRHSYHTREADSFPPLLAPGWVTT